MIKHGAITLYIVNMDRARIILGSSLLCMMLSSCVAAQPAAPTTSIPSPAPQTVITTSETETPTPTPTPTSTRPAPPVSTFALVCKPVTDDVVNYYPYAGTVYSPDKHGMAMVEIGNGNERGTNWWAVAANGPGYAITFITNAPAGGGTWIEVYNDFSDGWDNVSWSGKKLARGRAAVDKAIACLHNK